MTSTENPINEAAVPAAGTAEDAVTDGGVEIRPRNVLGLLPKYAAGKPPAAIEGLQAYKLSSNENPLPPLPAVLEAINAQTDIMRYPDPLSTALRTELASFLDVPAENTSPGAGGWGPWVKPLHPFPGGDGDGPPEGVFSPG